MKRDHKSEKTSQKWREMTTVKRDHKNEERSQKWRKITKGRRDDKKEMKRECLIQPIAFGVWLNLNLQSHFHRFLFKETWQKRPRELDSHLRMKKWHSIRNGLWLVDSRRVSSQVLCDSIWISNFNFIVFFSMERGKRDPFRFEAEEMTLHTHPTHTPHAIGCD